jgi:hypothetical protein
MKIYQILNNKRITQIFVVAKYESMLGASSVFVSTTRTWTLLNSSKCPTVYEPMPYTRARTLLNSSKCSTVGKPMSCTRAWTLLNPSKCSTVGERMSYTRARTLLNTA